MTNEYKDLRRKERPMTQSEIQARSNKKRQVKPIGLALTLADERERKLYERWCQLPNKKAAFVEAMEAYFSTIDNV